MDYSVSFGDSSSLQSLLIASSQTNVDESVTKELSNDELVQSLRDKLQLNADRKMAPGREELMKKRMQALASLPPQERAIFSSLMETLKTGHDEEVKKLNREMNESIQEARLRGSQRKVDLKRASLLKTFVNRSNNKGISSYVSCDALKSEISFILKVAGHYSIMPEEVEQSHRDQYRLELAEAARKDLLETEKKRKPNKRKKRRKPIRHLKTPSIESVSTNSCSTTSSHHPVSTSPVLPINILEPAVNEFVIELPRVTQRWKSNDPHVLRQIVDVSDGARVQKYSEMTDEEVLFQRVKHYLPGLESLILAPRAREKYAFKTNKGYGFLATLICDDKQHEGIIYLGVATSEINGKMRHTVYHKYFEELTDLNAVFQDKGHFIDEESSSYETSSPWEPVGLYGIVSRKDGKLDLHFKSEMHKVLIFPLID